jgi:hypothetical protein
MFNSMHSCKACDAQGKTDNRQVKLRQSLQPPSTQSGAADVRPGLTIRNPRGKRRPARGPLRPSGTAGTLASGSPTPLCSASRTRGRRVSQWGGPWWIGTAGTCWNRPAAVVQQQGCLRPARPSPRPPLPLAGTAARRLLPRCPPRCHLPARDQQGGHACLHGAKSNSKAGTCCQAACRPRTSMQPWGTGGPGKGTAGSGKQQAAGA